MSDIEKILFALEVSAMHLLPCELRYPDSYTLTNYIDELKARIAELEAYIDELENPQSIPDACTCEDNPQDDRAGLYIDPDCPIHGEVNNATS